MPPINPSFIGQGGFVDQQSAPDPTQSSLLSMLDGGGGNPYGGRTLAQILEGGAPMQQDVGGGYGYASPGLTAADWANQLANNENVSAGIQRGGRYQPDFARTLQSSGAEGGFFSIPGTQAESNIPWGYYEDPRKENPAPGLIGMSTNNWRLLPKKFQDPRFAMRAGHIIERSLADKPGQYVAQHGSPPVPQILQLGSGGHGLPLSFGFPFGPRGSFFPGQVEPWLPEGGPGGMGTGVT